MNIKKISNVERMYTVFFIKTEQRETTLRNSAVHYSIIAFLIPSSAEPHNL